MLKVTTEHGTYYLIDLEKGRAKRVKGDGRNDMYGDNEWFEFSTIHSYSRDTQTHGSDIEVGKDMYFLLRGPREYDWRISTEVVSIEEAPDGS
jgi:hypothetical protein